MRPHRLLREGASIDMADVNEKSDPFVQFPAFTNWSGATIQFPDGFEVKDGETVIVTYTLKGRDIIKSRIIKKATINGLETVLNRGAEV